MTTFKSMPLSKITVPKSRSRLVDDNHALAICASIEQQGQLTPILVRKTPNGKRPYELVAGAHRYRACELMDVPGEPEIDCLIVSADKEEAALIEVQDNIFRNELTKLDRAMAVQIYRDAWEKRYGKIDPKGGRPKNCANIAQLVSESAENGFATACAEKLGLSKRAIQYANQIANNLPQDLREALSGTLAADNQKQLLRFASLEPAKRKTAAKAIELSDGNVEEALFVLEGKSIPKPVTRDQKYFEKLFDAWTRTNEKVRQRFMDEVGLVASPGQKD